MESKGEYQRRTSRVVLGPEQYLRLPTDTRKSDGKWQTEGTGTETKDVGDRGGGRK